MTRLIVAAGGGGDAVAAAMLDAALYGDGDQTVILTYAWDRLLIDPIPGPRSTADFTGLEVITPAVRKVPAEARPIAPSGSTLPRLAAELPHTIALIDPRHGTEGVTRQVEELLTHLQPTTIDLLDIGGDVLARGGEPTLKSPLADSLTLTACAQVNAPVRLLVAGPGLDGELSHEDLRDLLGPVIHTLTAKDVEPIASVLEWHPSEATGMLAATARGVRGTCEIRDAALPIPLTDDSPTVHEIDLDEAEALSRKVCGFSEIDYERNKALWLKEHQPARLDADSVLPQLAQFEAEARSRGITHTTLRHLTEVLNLDGSQRDELRQLLLNSHPEQYAAPLWSITANGPQEPSRTP
ncbi:DUF1152 domain-containing protein [Streptomyces sp. NPDC002276]